MRYSLVLGSAGGIVAIIVAVLLMGSNHTSDTMLQNNSTGLANIDNLVLNGCTTDSDGNGTTDVFCPNYSVLHFTRDPPIKKSQWTGVQLTIDNGQYSIQYSTPTGTNQYFLVPTNPAELQSTLASPSSPIQKITRSFESEKLAIGNIFHKPIKGSVPTREELYQYALELINHDRTSHGVGPVALDSNPSAQSHADDMLDSEYFSHWNTDGVKPYVTYTESGGRGSVEENISVTAVYCPSLDCNPNFFDPFKQINDSEYGMMYNDAGSNWGHRDNILDPEHTDVDIGIAYNNDKFYFVEHFENNIINWQTVKLEDNQLHLVGKMPSGYSLFQIDVFEDPSPKPLTDTELNNNLPYNLGHYDQGQFAGIILPRPAANSHYPECSKGKAIMDTTKGEVCVDYVTFTNISTIPNGIDISPNISKWTNPGLHTVYVVLKKQNGMEVDATSITLEYLK